MGTLNGEANAHSSIKLLRIQSHGLYAKQKSVNITYSYLQTQLTITTVQYGTEMREKNDSNFVMHLKPP
jgi:hypothetical protein